jgi:hypothetical protein
MSILHPGAICGSRMVRRCLLAVTFVVGVSSGLQAQDSGVAISLDPPDLEGQELEDFEVIRENILTSFEDALEEDYKIVEDKKDARYFISLDIRGPIQECIWRVKCSWSEKGNDERNDCWDPLPAFTFCNKTSLDENLGAVTQMGCLGNIVDFSAPDTPKITQGDLCNTPVTNRNKVVYTTCFKVALQDTTWTTKIGTLVQRIPAQIADQLREDFRKLGYEIIPCFEGATPPPNIAFSVHGLVQEAPDEDAARIFVVLYVEKSSGLGADMMEKIDGETDHILRDDYEELGNAIVEHIKKQFDLNP